MKKIILTAITFLYMASGGYAGGFALNSISAPDLKGAAAPPPSAPLAVRTKTPELALGADMSIKIPFSELNKRMVGLAAMMKVLDQSKPVFFRQGEHIVFSNVTVDYHGVEAIPTVLMDPAFEGTNRLAIRFPKVDAEVGFGPKGLDTINKDDLLAAIADGLVGSMMESMDEAFVANKAGLKARDVLSFTYDKASWTMHLAINPNFVAPLLPGLVSDISLSAFSFDDAGFTLSVAPASRAALGRMRGYNLALSDGLLTAFLRRFAGDGDYQLSGRSHAGALRFRDNGRVELELKAALKDLPLKPDVYASIEFTPALTAPNTITLRFEKVAVDQAYGIGIPDAVSSLIQSRVLKVIVDDITNSKELAKTLSARKVDERTVEFKLKNTAFLPSFAKGASITKLKVAQDLMYLGFDF
ncbi:MAG: hypothetical protein NTY45_04775 [Elusimicrobia bacterium]|nr:hypothetical protein [Elusimicrobiota bacterium]